MDGKLKIKPTPWRAMIGESDPILIVSAPPEEFPVCEVGSSGGVTALDELHAQELVRRFNAYEELREALSNVVEMGAYVGDRLPIKTARPVFCQAREVLQKYR